MNNEYKPLTRRDAVMVLLPSQGAPRRKRISSSNSMFAEILPGCIATGFTPASFLERNQISSPGCTRRTGLRFQEGTIVAESSTQALTVEPRVYTPHKRVAGSTIVAESSTEVLTRTVEASSFKLHWFRSDCRI